MERALVKEVFQGRETMGVEDVVIEGSVPVVEGEINWVSWIRY